MQTTNTETGQVSGPSCQVCGADIVHAGRGRPRSYCDARCRELAKARAKMFPCSICGEPMHSGKGTLGPGKSICLPCRRSRPGYEPSKPKRENPWRIVVCPCGQVFETDNATRRYCSLACRPPRRRAPLKPRNEPRSKGRTGRPWRRVRAQVIAEESDCWLCGFEVDKELRYPHPMSASIDHVVPISEDGDPLERSNLRLAHLSCNRRRKVGRNEGPGDGL